MFFDNFDRYCKLMGKTNSEVAKEIGLDPSSCTGWRKGAIPRNGTLKKLADYFGVSTDDLLAEKKSPPGMADSEQNGPMWKWPTRTQRQQRARPQKPQRLPC